MTRREKPPPDCRGGHPALTLYLLPYVIMPAMARPPRRQPDVIRILILLAWLLPLPATAAELKIATWNLNWLTTRSAGDPELPGDVVPRSDDD